MESIRDVRAFPKTQEAMCLPSTASSGVSIAQLQELRSRVFQSAKESLSKMSLNFLFFLLTSKTGVYSINTVN